MFIAKRWSSLFAEFPFIENLGVPTDIIPKDQQRSRCNSNYPITVCKFQFGWFSAVLCKSRKEPYVQTETKVKRGFDSHAQDIIIRPEETNIIK